MSFLLVVNTICSWDDRQQILQFLKGFRIVSGCNEIKFQRKKKLQELFVLNIKKQNQWKKGEYYFGRQAPPTLLLWRFSRQILGLMWLRAGAGNIIFMGIIYNCNYIIITTIMTRAEAGRHGICPKFYTTRFSGKVFSDANAWWSFISFWPLLRNIKGDWDGHNLN